VITQHILVVVTLLCHYGTPSTPSAVLAGIKIPGYGLLSSGGLEMTELDPYYSSSHGTLYHGDALEILCQLPDESAQCCVTSPPYWGLRDYGVSGQIGLEDSPEAHVECMLAVFREVKRVLKNDGTLWVNYGDTYSYSADKRGWKPHGKQASNTASLGIGLKRDWNLPPKNLLGLPWRLAFALQSDGWFLRSDIIWCISGGTWLYAKTQKGDMPVMVKDLVRLDPRTVKLWNGSKWTQVLGWGRSVENSPKKIELVLRSGERIGCTGGHTWPTQRGNIRADNLIIGDTIKTCRLPDAETNKPEYLNNNILWLLGFYLAQGSRSGSTIQISLHANKIHWLGKIKNIIQHFGASITHDTDGNKLNIRLYGRILSSILDEYIGGHTAIDKHFRVSLWKLPNDCLRHFVQGYLDGDGHNDTKNKRYRLSFCRNYNLVRDLRVAAARLGATLTLTPKIARYQNGSKPCFRGEWRWNQSGHRNEKDSGEIIEIRASSARQFWDIAVEDDPHLFALASGVLTHNCKPNAMPESVKDRPVRAHEYLFLFSKRAKYFYDWEAVREPVAALQKERRPQSAQALSFARAVNEPDRPQQSNPQHRPNRNPRPSIDKKGGNQGSGGIPNETDMRNKRDVWTVPVCGCHDAHFATFPPALIEPCVRAGSRAGDIVLDPFMGSGTTGMVARNLGRRWVGVELNPDYCALALKRIDVNRLMLTEIAYA
jgi:DNA modification methylase